jgi:hypothetical protein
LSPAGKRIRVVFEYCEEENSESYLSTAKTQEPLV